MTGDVSGRSLCHGGSNSNHAIFVFTSIPRRRWGWTVPCLTKTREADEKLPVIAPPKTDWLATHPWAGRSPRPNLTYTACMETCKSLGCLSPTIHSVSCFSVNSRKNQPSFLGFHGGLLP